MKLKVMVVGSGGRESALVWKLLQSPLLGRLYVAPGNGGTSLIAQNVSILATDIEALADFAQQNWIDLTIVGPDNPLALGIVDVFRAQGLRIFGPTQAAARIESSKVFAKKLMREVGIPTAPFETFGDYDEALRHVQARPLPFVVKADGLALGKGVDVCHTRAQAEASLRRIMLDAVYGVAGKEVVIEDFLEGPELSLHVLCSDFQHLVFPIAQDHKALLDGGQGENTGGMGAVAPVPGIAWETLATLRDSIIRPILDAMRESGCEFTGVLYPGIKMTSDGPKVLEFNTRFGDPEAQCYMRLLESDLLQILMSACERGTLSTFAWRRNSVACVVLASAGYPGHYEVGIPIRGLDEAQKVPGVEIFHAGTAVDEGFVTSGGRVLSVTAIADNLQMAIDRAYEAANLINYEGKICRTDIGKQALTLSS